MARHSEALLPQDPTLDEIRLALGFQHEFRGDALRNWVLLGSWVHTDNDANIGIYEYDRDVVNLGMARNF